MLWMHICYAVSALVFQGVRHYIMSIEKGHQMTRLHSIERKALRQAQETLWNTRKLFWADLRHDHRTRNQMIADEIRKLGYDEVTWVQIGNQMQPQVYQ